MNLFYQNNHGKLYNGDVAKGILLQDKCVNCCVTSPPYWSLRDYGLPKSYWPKFTYTPMAGIRPVTIPEWEGCLGLEPTVEMYIGHMVFIFREVRRVLRDDGTLWINLGDSYCSTAPGTMGDRLTLKECKERTKRARKNMRPETPRGLKPKNLVGIPWRVAFALQADGWYLRQDIIWQKSNCMPESVKDRCTKSHEYIFLLAKKRHYKYDHQVIKEPCVQDEFSNGFRGGSYCNNATFNNSDGGKRKRSGNIKRRQRPAPGWGGNLAGSIPYEPTELRNKRSVWTVSTRPYNGAHFATFPPDLITPCILSGCPIGGTVLDPFMGSGTTAVVAEQTGRNWIGIELSDAYCGIATDRISKTG